MHCRNGTLSGVEDPPVDIQGPSYKQGVNIPLYQNPKRLAQNSHQSEKELLLLMDMRTLIFWETISVKQFINFNLQ